MKSVSLFGDARKYSRKEYQTELLIKNNIKSLTPLHKPSKLLRNDPSGVFEPKILFPKNQGSGLKEADEIYFKKADLDYSLKRIINNNSHEEKGDNRIQYEVKQNLRFQTPHQPSEKNLYNTLTHHQLGDLNGRIRSQESSIAKESNSQISQDSNQSKTEDKEINFQKTRIFHAVLLKRKHQQRLLNNNGLFINTQSKIDIKNNKEHERVEDSPIKNLYRPTLRLDESPTGILKRSTSLQTKIFTNKANDHQISPQLPRGNPRKLTNESPLKKKNKVSFADEKRDNIFKMGLRFLEKHKAMLPKLNTRNATIDCSKEASFGNSELVHEQPKLFHKKLIVFKKKQSTSGFNINSNIHSPLENTEQKRRNRIKLVILKNQEKQKENGENTADRAKSCFVQFTNKNKDTFEFNSPTQLPPFLSNDSENESEDHTERTPSFASSASKKRINQFISKQTFSKEMSSLKNSE